MSDELPTVPVSLWRDDAIVLFDWLINTDLDTVPITHPAQKQALTDLYARLEETLGPELGHRLPWLGAWGGEAETSP